MTCLWFTEYLMLGLQKWDRVLCPQDSSTYTKRKTIKHASAMHCKRISGTWDTEHSANFFCVNRENILEEESWTFETECVKITHFFRIHFPCAFYKHAAVDKCWEQVHTSLLYVLWMQEREGVKVLNENNFITVPTDFVGKHTRKQCMKRLCSNYVKRGQS